MCWIDVRRSAITCFATLEATCAGGRKFVALRLCRAQQTCQRNRQFQRHDAIRCLHSLLDEVVECFVFIVAPAV